MLAAVAPRQLDGCFIGFGAAVTKKHAIRKRVAAKLTRQLGLRQNMIEIGNVDQLARLLLDGAHDGRMAMAQAVNRDSGEKVEVFFSIGVPHPSPFATHQSDRIASVGVSDIIFGKLGDIAVLHLYYFLTTSVPTPSFVKISRRTACFTLPSMMCVLPTPPLRASMQHSTLGIIPEPTTPSWIILRA